jgi:replicative DNA helicase
MVKYNENYKNELLKENPLLENTVEIENTFIGGLIFVDFDELANVLPDIKPTDFYDKINADFYQGIIDFFSKNTSFDENIIMDYVAKNSKNNYSEDILLKKVADYLELASTHNLKALASIIVDRARQRNLYEVGEKIMKIASDISVPSSEAIEISDELLKKVAFQETKTNIVSLKELAVKAMQNFDVINNEGAIKSGYKTGFFEMDYMLNGLNPSDLIIIAGRPAMGKTAFALNLLTGFAKENPEKKAMIFSLEMGEQQLFNRFLSMEGEISNNILKQGILNDENAQKVGIGMSNIGQCSIKIVNEPILTPAKLRTIANLEKRLHGLDFIVIDYLQLMYSSNKSMNKQQEVSEISRELKLIARELDIPIVALSQLSRSLESRADKRPMLSDLRESGAIEQDADIVIFLYRDEYYNPQSPDIGKAEIIIAKHRNGAVGTIKMKFIPEFTKFKNILQDDDNIMEIGNAEF